MKRASSFNKILVAVFCILSILACYYKVFYGVFNDEEYLVAMGLRLTNGDRLFVDMWEMHQTTAVYAAVFMKPYLLLTGGYEGVFVFLRIMNVAVQGIVAGITYVIFRKKGKYDIFLSWLCALLVFNFMPKWVADFEYAQMMYLFVTLSMLFLYRAGSGKELFLSGVFFALAVWAYPTMVAVFPVILVCIYILTKRKSDPVFFSLGCICTALPFMWYVLRGISMGELIRVIPYIISDEKHVNNIEKLMMLGRECIRICGRGIPVILASAMVWFLHDKVRKKRTDPVVSIVSVSAILFFVVILAANILGRSSGPYGLNTRYIVLFISGFYLYHKNKDRENRELFYVFYIPNLFIYFIVVFSSLLGLEVSASYLIPGILAVVIMLYRQEKLSCFAVPAIICFVFSLIVYRGYFVVVDGTVPACISEQREVTEEGPEKGIHVYPYELASYVNKLKSIAGETKAGDSVLFLTDDTVINLFTQGKACGCTMIDAIPYGKQWIYYYDDFGHESPDIIVADKSKTGDINVFLQENVFGKWIAGRYEVDESRETEELVYLFRKDPGSEK